MLLLSLLLLLLLLLLLFLLLLLLLLLLLQQLGGPCLGVEPIHVLPGRQQVGLLAVHAVGG